MTRAEKLERMIKALRLTLDLIEEGETSTDPTCVCGHVRSLHDGPKCTVPLCACGPGCIHDGFVDAAHPTGGPVTAPALSPAPDFAAIWKIAGATYVEPGPDVEGWLRATFGQDPAPSPAPRSPSAAVALDALQSYADGDGATDLRNVAALVAGVKPELYYPPPAPAPAFDVEALADAIARKHYPHGPPCSLDGLRDTVRDAARDMLKGGVK